MENFILNEGSLVYYTILKCVTWCPKNNVHNLKNKILME